MKAKVKYSNKHSTQTAERKWTRINYKFLRCFFYQRLFFAFAFLHSRRRKKKKFCEKFTTEKKLRSFFLMLRNICSSKMFTHIVWFALTKAANEKKHQTLFSREHQYIKNPSVSNGAFMPFIFIWILIQNNFQFHMRRLFVVDFLS